MELAEGRVITMSPVGLLHGQVAQGLANRLSAFATDHKLGTVMQQTGFRLRRDPDVVRAPDVSFLRAERIPAKGARRGFIDGAPDLAIEVLSSDDRTAEILRKVAEYLDAGTPRVWVVDPDAETVTVHRGDRSRVFGVGETLSSDDAGLAAEGFELAVGDVVRPRLNCCSWANMATFPLIFSMDHRL